MNRFFECKMEYYPEHSTGLTKRVYLVDALTFTEAEAHMTKYLIEYEDINDFLIQSLRRVKYDDIVHTDEIMEDYKWYEAKVKVKTGGGSDAKYKYLVAHDNPKSVINLMNDYLVDSQGEFKVVGVQEKEIEDIVMRKVCCEECEVCESNIRILNFDEQRDIDQKMVKFSELQGIEMVFMNENGAFSMTKKKYKVKVNDENLERAIGKRLGRQVKRTWTEDLVDEDSGEVKKVERHEIVLSIGDEITAENVELIKEAAVEQITLYKE